MYYWSLTKGMRTSRENNKGLPLYCRGNYKTVSAFRIDWGAEFSQESIQVYYTCMLLPLKSFEKRLKPSNFLFFI